MVFCFIALFTVSLLEDIGLRNGSWVSHARLTRGPGDVLGAYEITQDLIAPLSSENWQAVANATPEGFALHVHINPGFDFKGILVAINSGTNADFTVALAASTMAMRNTLVLKIPGIVEPMLFDVPEVNAGWIRYDFLFRDNQISLYLDCGLLNSMDVPGTSLPISPSLGPGNDALRLSNGIKVRPEGFRRLH